MKALAIDRYGPIAGLAARDVAEPSAGADSVLVQVDAAGVNPSDVGIALGRFPSVTLPRVLGRDFAGRVVAGPADLVGAAVWGSGGGELGITRDGTHAQVVVLPASGVARRPSNLNPEEAAGAGVPFVAAWSALVTRAAFKAGEWVLISGASGAVGTAAAQLAVALGGNAIGLVRDTESVDPTPFAAVLHIERDDIPKAVRELTGGRGADVALNGVGAPAFAALVESLAHGGRMTIYSAAGGREVPFDLFGFYRKRLTFFGLDTVGFDLATVAQILTRLAPMIESNALRPPPVAARFPLSRAREAYERVESGTPGKVVILPNAT